MNVEWLTKLADLLEADAAKEDGLKFDLNTWAHDVSFDENYVSALNFGTSGCAMGLAAISGQFPGLTLDPYLMMPVFGRDLQHKSGLDAAVAAFGLTYGEAARLFLPDSYTETTGAIAELEVAARIRQLLAYNS